MNLSGEEALVLAKKYTDEHGGSGGGTSNYNDLSNKPVINNVILSGSKSLSDLGIASSNTVETLQNEINDIKLAIPKVYGFHINGNESSPSNAVTYISDAVGMTPAYMDYENESFNYGSWGDVWFIRDCKPCILGTNGTVLAYLNKNDYTEDIYGNTVTIDSSLTDANVMIEFPKIWYKIVPDPNNNTSASVYISPIKVDEDYKDYAYIDYQGYHKEHFYMPAYNGSNVDNVIRSISGVSIARGLSSQTEINYCKANGDGWFTEDAGEVMLINFLLILMCKSLDTKTAFGSGINTGGENAVTNFVTGAGNTKGMFYGSNDGVQLVKIFGIENWWGLQARRYAGDINDNGTRKIKLCYGNDDGSSTLDFNTNGGGYVDVGITPSGTNGGYINEMIFTKNGMLSSKSSGSSSTYYCDAQWFNNSRLSYAYRGGSSGEGNKCGAFCVLLDHSPDATAWYHSANLSYK